MSEPAPARGETWETFLERCVAEKSTVELAMAFTMPWWVRDEYKTQLHILYRDIDCAERHLGITYDDV